jgi:hypothetical protein
MVHESNPICMGGGRRRIGVLGEKNVETLPEDKLQQKGLGCGASVEYLPSKHQVLSSNPSTYKKRKKMREDESLT